MAKGKSQKETNENDVKMEIADVSLDQSGVAAEGDTKESYEAMCQFCNPIAQPLASRKLSKKLYKLIKKASKEKNYLRQGVAEVQRALRKGEKGVVILAGNVTPIEVYCHIPAICEEKEIPYVFTPSKEHLGLAAGHKRPSIMMLVKLHADYQELFDECSGVVDKLPLPVAM